MPKYRRFWIQNVTRNVQIKIKHVFKEKKMIDDWWPLLLCQIPGAGDFYIVWNKWPLVAKNDYNLSNTNK